MFKKSLYICGVFALVFVISGCKKSDSSVTIKPEKSAISDETTRDVMQKDAEIIEEVENPVARFDEAVNPSGQENGIPSPGEGTVVPSPRASDAEPLSAAENQAIAAEAEACTKSGGLFNSSLRECFKDAQEENAATDDTRTELEILPTDDAETIKRKECVNGGGIYNSEQKQCFSPGENS